MKAPKIHQLHINFIAYVSIALSLSACSAPEKTNTTPTYQLSDSDADTSNELVEYSTDLSQFDVVRPATINTNNQSRYPTRNGYNIKAIQPDNWANSNELINANTSGVAINLVWSSWQPTLKAAQCDVNTEVQYGGYCFQIQEGVNAQIKYWSSRGVLITAIVWGVPEWANIGSSCKAEATIGRQFCANANPANFARFTGMLASRYNNANKLGRIADFVIHNEVNMSEWYNIGCGLGVTCNLDEWIGSYSADFNAAYDSIKKHQPAAKVFIPFAHQFGHELDDLDGNRPVVSLETFLPRFHSLSAGRKWRVAYHPYNKNLLTPDFSVHDYPYVTYGNIGILAAWLRKNFPNQPESWEIHSTESGVNSVLGSSNEEAQAIGVCNSLRNILGTPGIESYIYHRMKDHAVEVSGGAGFGLHNEFGAPKLAWDVWAGSNGGNGQQLDCGFESLPYTKLTQYSHNVLDSRTSTRVPPAGYIASESWRLMREYEDNTVMLYECANTDSGSYASLDLNCNGDMSLGPVGYSFKQEKTNTVPLFACQNSSVTFNSSDATCGTSNTKEFLGYVYR